MELDWVNAHTHKRGDGINIIDPCLGEVEKGKKDFFSLGIHPLFIDEKTGERLEKIEKAAAEKSIVAVGEAGADRNAASPIPVQLQWLEQQIRIAQRYDLPLIIHGVRAIPEIIALAKKYASFRKWIFHGFNNRREMLEALLQHGFYISAGRQAMNEKSPLYQLLPEIPLQHLLIETDNSDFSIQDIYRQVAERRGETVENLKAEVFGNFCRLFRVC